MPIEDKERLKEYIYKKKKIKKDIESLENLHLKPVSINSVCFFTIIMIIRMINSL